MVFLASHYVLNKYYPNMWTQFIFGVLSYIFIFLIFKDFLSEETYQKYRYYLLAFVGVDILFFFYLVKSKTDSREKDVRGKIEKPVKKQITVSTDQNSGSLQSISLTSEINDFKITHDVSSSDHDSYSIFSTSEEKSDHDPKDLKDKEKSASLSLNLS